MTTMIPTEAVEGIEIYNGTLQIFGVVSRRRDGNTWKFSKVFGEYAVCVRVNSYPNHYADYYRARDWSVISDDPN